MALEKKKQRKRPEGAKERGAYTTVTTRLTASQIEQVRDAARRCGWSLAQFLQRGAVERATEIVNRDDNRNRISKAARSVVSLFGHRPFRVVFGGETWVSDDPEWMYSSYSNEGHVVRVLERGEYIAIMEDEDKDVGTAGRPLSTQVISVFDREALGDLALDNEGLYFEDADVNERFNHTGIFSIPFSKALTRVEQARPRVKVQDIIEAIRHSGREFAVLMRHERGEQDRRQEYVDAGKLLGDGNVSGRSVKGERS